MTTHPEITPFFEKFPKSFPYQTGRICLQVPAMYMLENSIVGYGDHLFKPFEILTGLAFGKLSEKDADHF